MEWLKNRYLHDIEVYQQAIQQQNGALNVRARRRIWDAVGAEIRIAATFDPGITDSEMEEIDNVLNRQVL